MGEILVIEPDADFARRVAESLGRKGHGSRVTGSPAHGIAELRRSAPDVVLVALELPGGSDLSLLDALRRDGGGVPIVVLAAGARVADAVEAMRRGAADFLEKPVAPGELAARIAPRLEGGRARHRLVRNAVPDAGRRLVAEHPRLRDQLDRVERLRAAELPPGERPTILIAGETGVGKSLLAAAIHERLGGGRLVELDCEAVSAGSGDPGLFGGPGTGAPGGIGQEAAGGTLLLDEVGALAPELQARLIGVIEARSRAPLGSPDVHVVATTRRDLDAAVAGGAFRADLLHRLRTLSFEVPPLRERGDEILCIARRLCEELAPRYRRNGVEVAGEAEAVLRRHPWPGNVRELRNALEHALLIETGSVLDAKVLEQVLARPRAGPGGAPLCELPEQGIDLGRMERDLIERALHQCGGNRTQAARFLGLSRYKLRYRMKKWGLD